MRSRKNRKQSTQEIKLEEALLHQSPSEIEAECSQDSPRENAIGNCWPSTGAISKEASDRQECQCRGKRYPQCKPKRSLKPVFNYCRRGGPNDSLCVASRKADAKQRRPSRYPSLGFSLEIRRGWFWVAGSKTRSATSLRRVVTGWGAEASAGGERLWRRTFRGRLRPARSSGGAA
jgi:hypothetical protein